jgi:hypothetical protein
MGRRPRYQRQPDDFKPGSIAPWPPGKPPPESIAQRAQYVASGEHKDYPSPDGLWTVVAKVDKAKCARFARTEWHRLQEVLREAISAPCVHVEFRGDFPARAWAFINGDLHEARLSNRGNGEYHGFPLEYQEQWPDDPNDLLRNAPRVSIALG